MNRRVINARREWFGATVMLANPDALLFVDQTRADALGIERVACPPDILRGPLDVHLAVTTRCTMSCPGCYAQPKTPGPDITLEQCRAIFESLRKLQVFSIALGGGEPLLHPRVLEIASLAREYGLVVNMTTNGTQMSSELAAAMKGLFSNIHLSWHGPDDEDQIVRAASLLRKYKVNYGLNVLASRQTWDSLPRAFQLAKKEKCGRVLVLRYKTIESNLHQESQLALTDAMGREYYPTLRSLARKHRIMPMVDCSAFPLLAREGLDRKTLEFSDVNGCVGGHHCLAITVDGLYKPCSFWDKTFGHITDLTPQHWIESPELNAFRHADREACTACEYLQLCNGGCRLPRMAATSACRG